MERSKRTKRLWFFMQHLILLMLLVCMPDQGSRLFCAAKLQSEQAVSIASNTFFINNGLKKGCTKKINYLTDSKDFNASPFRFFLTSKTKSKALLKQGTYLSTGGAYLHEEFFLPSLSKLLFLASQTHFFTLKPLLWKPLPLQLTP